MPNKLFYPTGNVPTENGVEILWSEGVFSSKGSGVMVKFRCPAKKFLGDECPLTGLVQARRALKQGRNFRALHTDCYRKVRRRTDCESLIKVYRPRRFDELPLPKGTKVLYHIRHPQNTHMVGIECRGCFKDTGQIKYIQDSTINHYVNGGQWWDELCSECVKRRGSVLKINEDRQSKKSETVTLFRSCVVDGMVGVVASTCKCLWFTTMVNAVNNWDIYIEVCPDCQRPSVLPKRLRLLGLLDAPAQPQNGDGQKDVDEKLSQLTEVVRAVISCWSLLRRGDNQDARRVKKVGLADVGSELGINQNTDEEDKNYHNRVRSQLKTRGMKDKFPLFRKTVIDNFEAGHSAEESARAFLKLLSSAKKDA
ncbi:MAG TPA: hypothetical protein VHU19_03610 [Pyrinomonadaceae bacterium]|jgi:hypothetical protein|nr:hypothetical protein [Pyrinomonadaceae bacterium]